MTRCPFCGVEFDEAAAHTACQSCSMSAVSCSMIKCPNCGYEIPGEAKLFKLIKRVRSLANTLKPDRTMNAPK